MAPNEQGQNATGETAQAGEGRWEQGSGQVQPGGGTSQPPQDVSDEEAREGFRADRNDNTEVAARARGDVSGGIDAPADQDGREGGDYQPRDPEIEQRADQVSGPGGAQRPRAGEDLAVFDPGRVGLEAGDDRNPSDPANYPDPGDQRRGTSREEPGLTDQASPDTGGDRYAPGAQRGQTTEG